jgi:hypothetical protein
MINLDRLDRVYARGLMPLDAVRVVFTHADLCGVWRGEACDCPCRLEIVAADGDRIAIDKDGNIIPPAKGNG